MRRGQLERKLFWGVVAIFVVPTALIEGILIVLYGRGVFQDPWGLLLAILIGLAATMAYLSWIAHALGRSVIRTVRTIQHGAELMTTVNPAHRIEVRTGDELEALAQDINQLADHLRDARSVLEGRAVDQETLDSGGPLVDRGVSDTRPAREHRLDELTFVVLDVETTGLRPDAGDRIVSLAGVRVRAGTVRAGETFDSLVCPERPIPAASTCVHGITDAMVANAPMIADVLPAFFRFAEGAVLVGHEASFDMAFLRRDMVRLGLVALAAGHPVLDTRLLSRVVHGPGPEHALEAVAERLGVKVIGRHSALGDALTTAEIFVRLLPLLNRRGLVTLGATLDVVRRGLTPPTSPGG